MSETPFLTAPALRAVAGVSHGFFTRNGGVSSGEYASLNCGLFSGDDPSAVAENRARVCRALGCGTLHSLRQVHGVQVIVVDGSEPGEPVRGDGLVTIRSGVGLGVLGADCAPVLLADGGAGVVGAAHGGWRGALAGVTDEVVAAMRELGAKPESIVAAIGPAIQRNSYEVGEDFRDEMLARSPAPCEDCFAPGGGGPCFDLPRYLEKRLKHAGVGRVERIDADTRGNERDYFSHRRGALRGVPERGRQVSAICFTGEGAASR